MSINVKFNVKSTIVDIKHAPLYNFHVKIIQSDESRFRLYMTNETSKLTFVPHIDEKNMFVSSFIYEYTQCNTN